jgi:uncharacterized repeat protein (TIGR01451 family)
MSVLRAPRTRLAVLGLSLALLAAGCDRPGPRDAAGLPVAAPAEGMAATQARAASLEAPAGDANAVTAVGVVQERVVVVKDAAGQPLAGVQVDWLLPANTDVPAVLLKDEADEAGGPHQANSSDALGRSTVWLRAEQPGLVKAMALVQTGAGKPPLLLESSAHVVDARVEPARQVQTPSGAGAALVTRVLRVSDGKPLAGYAVRWTLANAQQGRFRESGGDRATSLTDARGVARIHVLPGKQAVESAQVKVDVEQPAGRDCQCRQHGAVRIGGGQTRLAWGATGPEAAKPAAKAELRLSLACPQVVDLGEQVEYRLALSNTGTAPARAVRVVDALPPALRHDSGKTTLEWSHARINPGETLTATIPVTAEAAGAVENVARIHGTTLTAHCVTQVRHAELALSKQGPAARYLGQTVRYDMQVRNTGDGVARRVVVGDAYPAGLRFLSASPDAGHDADKRQITWTLDNLAAGETRQLRADFKAAEIGQPCNQVRALAERGAEAQARACTEVRGLVALRLEVVDSPDPVVIGTSTLYRIEVLNQGTATATQVAVRGRLPEALAFIEAGGPTQAVVEGRDIRFGPLASLAPGEKVVYTVRARALSEGDVRFATELTAQELDAPVRETESTRLYD